MDDPQPETVKQGAPEYLNILVANAPLAMAMFDQEMRYLVANNLWIKEFHLEEIPVTGESHYEIFPDLHESWKEVYERCLEGHVERCEEDIFQRPDGSRDWVRWEVRPWRHQNGEIGGLIISCEMVTERKRAEQRVQFEKDFTEGLLAGAAPVVVVDLDGRIGRSSEGAKELSTAIEIEEGKTLFWEAFADESERSEMESSFFSEINRAGENGTFSFPNSTVTVYTDKNGQRRKIAWTNTAQRNDLGEVDRIIRIGFEKSVTQEPVAEEPLVEVEEDSPEPEEEPGMVEDIKLDAEIERDEEEAGVIEDSFDGEPESSAEPEGIAEEQPGNVEEDIPESLQESPLDSVVGKSEQDSEIERTPTSQSAPDAGNSLRELAEKVRAARGAASGSNRKDQVQPTGVASEEGDADEFLVGQAFVETETSADTQESPKDESARESSEDESESVATESEHQPDVEGDDSPAEIESKVDEPSAESSTEDTSGPKAANQTMAQDLSERIAQLEASVTRQLGGSSQSEDDELTLSESHEEEPEAVEEPEAIDKPDTEEDEGVVLEDAAKSDEDDEPPLVAAPKGSAKETAEDVEEQEADEPAESAAEAGTESLDQGAEPDEEPDEATDLEPKKVLPAPPASEVPSKAKPEPPVLKQELESESTGGDEHEQAAENLPFGLLLLDEEVDVLYSNPKFSEILGFGISEDSGVEEWFRQACPDGSYAEEVLGEWRSSVWRRQLTKTFTLSNVAGALREVEFRPNLLDDGRLLLTVLDVTDSRRSEEALRASEAKFRAVFQDSGVGIALVDQTGDVFDANPAMETLVNTKRTELRLKAFEDFVFEEDLPLVRDSVGDVLKGNRRAVEVTARLEVSDGDPVWTRLNVVVVRDPEGDPMFTAYFAHDISEQRQATMELEESQLQNRALLEATPDLLFLIDAEGTVEDYICSADFPIKVGESVVGANLRKVVPQLKDTLDAYMTEVSKSNSVVKGSFSAGGHTFETRLVRSGDSHRVMVVRDLPAVPEQTDFNREAFAAFEEAVTLLDLEGVVLEWNRGAEELFGVESSKAVGKSLPVILGAGKPAALWNTIRGAVSGVGKWENDQFEFSGKDGAKVTCSSKFTAFEVDESGKPKSVIGIHRPDTKKEEEATTGLMKSEEVAKKITNNLQIIYSLLNLQVNTLEDEDSRRTLLSSQNRVRAISFVHQQLKMGGDERQLVDFAGFVDMMADHLRDVYGTPPSQVGVRIGFSDIFLPLEASIPLALAVNELLSNALRHGFADEAITGEVGIELRLENGKGLLIVRNTGESLPDADFEDLKGLGLHIATTLVQQIGGSLVPGAGPDTAFVVQFQI